MAEGGEPPALSAADVEAKLRAAMVSRVPYFKEQADSLTFEGVRRLMEKDLGLDTYALDVHKRIVKQCLQECLEPASKDEDGINQGDAEEIVSEVDAPEKESKEPDSKGDDEMEDSPVMGLMAGNEKSKSETKGAEVAGNIVPTEAVIKEAISKRAPHFRKNAETITMAGARRLLEEDLKVDKFALDPFKKLISEEVNEILSAPQVSRSTTGSKKKTSRKSSEVESSSSSDKESDVEEDDVKPRRKPASKGKSQNLSGLKKRKQADEAVKEAKSKKPKPSKGKSNLRGEDGDDSGQENSESSAEMAVKKKDVPKPTYSRRVENLKSVIKSCGMSIPPIIYKKVKQAPESKREAALIKELEDILAKEGLSANPSEKEIKEVKKRKDRAKELEGIDMSNIVTSSRRRSAFSFAPPPKPKVPVESAAHSGESSSSSSDDDEDEDEEDEEEEEVEEEEGAGEEQDEEEDDNESKSEENEDEGVADSD